MTPQVTILIPTRNGLPHLRETLGSLRDQTFRDYRLVVLDDASDDDSAGTVAAFHDPRFAVVRNDQALGIPRNWNRGIDLVQTPFFALCHHDDVYEPQFLEVLLELLGTHDRAFIAHSKVRTIDGDGSLLTGSPERYKNRFWPADEPAERDPSAEFDVLRRADYVVTPAVVYRTSAIRTIGPFDERFQMASDWQYWLRGLLAGYTIVGTHRALMRYRRHEAMTTRSLESDLSRYAEELAVAQWASEEGYAGGLTSDPGADYRTITKVILSDLASRLSRGDTASATELLRFAQSQVPGFAGSAADRLARTMARLGPLGGSALRAARFLAAYGWRPSRGSKAGRQR